MSENTYLDCFLSYIVLDKNQKQLLPVQFTTLNFFLEKSLYKNIVYFSLTMNYWKKQYTEAKTHFQNSLSHIKGVILGFNVNLDKIIEITPEILKEILELVLIILKMYLMKIS